MIIITHSSLFTSSFTIPKIQMYKQWMTKANHKALLVVRGIQFWYGASSHAPCPTAASGASRSRQWRWPQADGTYKTVFYIINFYINVCMYACMKKWMWICTTKQKMEKWHVYAMQHLLAVVIKQWQYIIYYHLRPTPSFAFVIFLFDYHKMSLSMKSPEKQTRLPQRNWTWLHAVTHGGHVSTLMLDYTYNIGRNARHHIKLSKKYHFQTFSRNNSSPCNSEHCTHHLLTLTHPLRREGGGTDAEEGGPALAGYAFA